MHMSDLLNLLLKNTFHVPQCREIVGGPLIPRPRNGGVGTIWLLFVHCLLFFFREIVNGIAIRT